MKSTEYRFGAELKRYIAFFAVHEAYRKDATFTFIIKKYLILHESYAVFNKTGKVKFSLHASHAPKPLDLKKQACERNITIFHHSVYVSIHLLSSPPPLLPPHPRSCFPWKHGALVYRRCCCIIPPLQNNQPPFLCCLYLSVFWVLPFLHSCVASDAPALQELLGLLISLRPISRRGGVGGCFAQSLFVSVHSPSLCTTAT